MKRLLDILLSAVGLLAVGPILAFYMLLVLMQDWHSPLYIAPRVGKNGKLFKMVKLRSMVVEADRSEAYSTSATDARITRLGKIIRKCKLDELTQLWNVLCGDMSLVGPRPQVERDVLLYTDEEKGLLAVRPGITDFSSIVFADEGDILADKPDPVTSYQQLIRPWKSRLGLFYIQNQSLMVDFKLIFFTLTNSVNRRRTLLKLSLLLNRLGASQQLCRVAERNDTLIPFPPPGSGEVVTAG